MKKSKENSLINFVSDNFNLFSFQKTLHIDGREKKGTLSGFLLTIIVVCASLYMMIYFLLIIASRKKPNIFYTEESYLKNNLLNLNTTKFLLGLGVNRLENDQYLERLGIDESYIKFKAYILSETVVLDDKSKSFKILLGRVPLKMINCNNLDLEFDSEAIKDFFKAANLTKSLCLDKDQLIPLSGRIGDQYVNSLGVDIERCQNTTENQIICKSSEEINSYVNQLEINLGVMNSIVDLFSPNEAIKPYYDLRKFRIANEVQSSVTIDLKEDFLISDNDFFNFFQPVKENYVNIENLLIESLSVKQNIFLGKIKFQMNTKRGFTYRSYDKIQDLIARTLAMYQLFRGIAAFFLGPFLLLSQKLDMLKILHVSKPRISSSTNKKKEIKEGKFSLPVKDWMKLVLSGGVWISSRVKQINSRYDRVSKAFDVIFLYSQWKLSIKKAKKPDLLIESQKLLSSPPNKINEPIVSSPVEKVEIELQAEKARELGKRSNSKYRTSDQEDLSKRNSRQDF